MSDELAIAYHARLVTLAEENGRLTAELIVATTERDVERERSAELENELRALRARIAARETEQAIAELYSAPLEAVGQ